MGLIIKICVGIFAFLGLLLGFMLGSYLAGWLTLFLLHLWSSVTVDGMTYWQYWDARHLPQLAPYALRIELAGIAGFGISSLLWLGLLYGLFRYILWPLLKTEREQVREARAQAAWAARRQKTPEQIMAEWTEQMGKAQPDEAAEPEPKRPPAPVRQQPDQSEPPKRTVQPVRPQTTPLERPDIKRNDPVLERASDEQQQQESDMNFKQMTAAVTLGVAAGAMAAGHADTRPYETEKPALPAHSGVIAHFNRHPQDIYQLTLTVHDAPGPLKQSDGGINYTVNTVECVPPKYLDNDTGGTLLGVQAGITLHNRWPSKGIGYMYKTYIATDFVEPENYFGLKVCHWVVNDLDLDVDNGGDADKYVAFISTIKRSDIESGKEIKTYFLKDNYINPEFIGKAFTEEQYLKTPEPERSKFFYTTISVKKAKPRAALQRWIWINALSNRSD